MKEENTDKKEMMGSTDDDNVVISKKTLESILNKQEEQENKITTLLAVADKSRLERLRENDKTPKGSTVKIGTIDGKYVVGWRMTKNDVYKDPKTMVWHEIQNIEFLFDDDSKIEMDYLNGIKSMVKVVAEVVERTKDISGKETLKVQLSDGRFLLVGVEFVN